MPDWVSLARIGRARGIRGEVNAEITGSSPDRFSPGLAVTLVRENVERPEIIESVWFQNETLVLKFAGCSTRTAAEELRGFDVCIPETDREPAPEGEFYLSDLVGCRVESPDGRLIGEVRAWHEYGAAPLLEVRNGEREVLVPFTDVFYRTVDLAGRRIVVELPEGLEDLNAK